MICLQIVCYDEFVYFAMRDLGATVWLCIATIKSRFDMTLLSHCFCIISAIVSSSINCQPSIALLRPITGFSKNLSPLLS